MQIATQNPKSDPDFLAARGLYVSPGSAIVTCYGRFWEAGFSLASFLAYLDYDQMDVEKCCRVAK